MASALEISKLEAEKELLALAKAEEDEQKDLAMLFDSENPEIFSLEDVDELLQKAGDSEDDFGDDLGDLAAALLGVKASIFSTVGWKSLFTAKILQEEAVTRIEVAAV